MPHNRVNVAYKTVDCDHKAVNPAHKTVEVRPFWVNPLPSCLGGHARWSRGHESGQYIHPKRRRIHQHVPIFHAKRGRVHEDCTGTHAKRERVHNFVSTLYAIREHPLPKRESVCPIRNVTISRSIAFFLVRTGYFGGWRGYYPIFFDICPINLTCHGLGFGLFLHNIYDTPPVLVSVVLGLRKKIKKIITFYSRFRLL